MISLFPPSRDKFNREKQEADDRFACEKAKLEKELSHTKERLEQELGAREAAVAAKETELSDLRKQAAQHPKELEAAYQKVQDIAVKTVEGASNSKSPAGLQQLLGEHIRKESRSGIGD